MKDHMKHLFALVVAALLIVSATASGQESTTQKESAKKRDSLRTLDTTVAPRYESSQGIGQDSVQGSAGVQDTMRRSYDNQDTMRGIGIGRDTTQGSRGDLDTLRGSYGERDSVRADPSLEPDNTGVNKRDRDDDSVTADEQGQSADDIETTRQIRRAIMGDDSLSTYAKNVKIITKDGVVTLKGPVRSEQEKSALEAKAVAVAGAAKVKNQIEVKTADPSQEP